MIKPLLLITMVLFLFGCEKELVLIPKCPTVKVLNVKLKVNHAGGLDRHNRIKAFKVIRYYSVETARVNSVIADIEKNAK